MDESLQSTKLTEKRKWWGTRRKLDLQMKVTQQASNYLKVLYKREITLILLRSLALSFDKLLAYPNAKETFTQMAFITLECDVVMCVDGIHILPSLIML